MSVDPNQKKPDHPAVIRMQKKKFWDSVKRHVKLVLLLAVLIGAWVGYKKWKGEEPSFDSFTKDLTGSATEAIALLDEELKRQATPSDQELALLLRKNPIPPAAPAGGTPATPPTPEGPKPGPDGGPKPPAGTDPAKPPAGGGTTVTTTPVPEPSPEEKAVQAKVKEANQSFDSCLAHYEKFRSSSDRKVRGSEILAALKDIQKASGIYASGLETLPDNAWLQERHHKSIEILKEVRMKAEQYK